MKIKFYITTILFSLLFFNCNNSENKELKRKLIELKGINKSLIDSIRKIEYSKITSAEMLIISNNSNNKFSGMILNQFKGKKFNLYQLDTLHYAKGVERKLIYENYSNSQFEIQVDNKLIKNKTLYLLAEYNLDSLKVQIPGVLFIE